MKVTRFVPVLATFSLLVAVLALPARAQDAPVDLQKALAQLQQMQQGAPKADPVDFRELKKLLPEELLGLPRTSVSGSKSGMMGMKVSMAEADYGKGPRTIHVTIMDAAGTPLGAAAGWSMLGEGYEQETDDGWERVRTVGGHLLHESWSKDDRVSTADMVIGNRFIVSIELTGGQPGDALKALQQVDVNALAEMAARDKK